MLFSSPTFFVFFALYFVLHLLVPRGYRNYLIIAGSTIFYAWWKVEYVWVPYLLMAIAYFGVQWIAGAREHTARKGRMLITVILLFLPLLFFKYTNFLYRDIVGLAFDVRDELLELPLPLGISFITFTLTALVVDTFSSKFPPTSSPRTVLAYVLFFPHLIAGPILRPIELIPQLEHPRGAFAFRTIPAVAIFTLGLVKKLVFADQVAEVVDGIYAKTALPSGTEALFAVYGFAVQIYCDFSGYTDMAIGLALLLGARLPNNFARPYCSTTIIEFWRRWHITLSFWLRDYLYIPLGGSRGSRVRELVNILITMALGGLWHGANLNFVIWGICHGMGVSFVHAFRRLSPRVARQVPSWLGILFTFHFVTLAWILFRAPSLSEAKNVANGLILGGYGDALTFLSKNIFVAVLIVLFILLHRFDDHRRLKWLIRRSRAEITLPFIAACWILAITISHGSSAKFIYFDF
jgi:D-alanyl-lipoteichoic acid acyltransferase DltB (MBOAT superfamily)